VHFGAVTTATPGESSKTFDEETSSEHPQLTIPERAKESEPLAAPPDAKKDVDAPTDDVTDGLPSQPTHAATQ
jgi:hypothetical protein